MRLPRALAGLALALTAVVIAPTATASPIPPLRTSPNVHLLGNIPGSYAGIAFSGTHAFATGWGTGLTVLDISKPEAPALVGQLPLPHFENEDVEVCGDTVLISNDREAKDLGGVLNVIDVADPTVPTLLASLPMGLTGSGRGPGHIANFVNASCTQVWVDGGDHVAVIDLTDRAAPKMLGSFQSVASVGPDPKNPSTFVVSHDTELDAKGISWNVGGGGIAGYRVSKDPLKPLLVASSGMEGVNIHNDGETSPYNDFIIHNSKRMGRTLLVTEEDYIDQDEDQPGSCHGQGKFETWAIRGGAAKMKPIDTWQTELNGYLAGGDAEDSKAPVTVNCSSHWFEERGGIAAVGWYEQGVRFLDVRNPRDIRQVGYYLPADGATWAAYWAPTGTNIVYTADPARGIDVLRIDDPTKVDAASVQAPILDEWFGTPTAYVPSKAFGYSCSIKPR